MSCEKHDKFDKVSNCVCDAVIAIKKAQDQVSPAADDCVNNCFDNLLSPTATNDVLDTVPFVLQTKKGNFFPSVGAIGTEDCFTTVFFRVEDVDKHTCCATLSMLRPDMDLDFDECCVDPRSLCDISSLERTGFCIEVDLNCFCAIQCLDPNLVAAEPKKRKGCC